MRSSTNINAGNLNKPNQGKKRPFLKMGLFGKQHFLKIFLFCSSGFEPVIGGVGGGGLFCGLVVVGSGHGGGQL